MTEIKKNWPFRLQFCSNQLKLAIEARESNSIENWLAQGFEASEHCETMLESNGLNPDDIEKIKEKIDNFKLICKND